MLTPDEISKINSFFRIKVTGVNYIKPSINRRFTHQGFRELLGDWDLADKISKKALKSTDEVPTVKLRRGLLIKYEENTG